MEDEKKKKVFIGIDVGKDGGIVAISEDFEVRSANIPKIGLKVDLPALFESLKTFKNYDVFVGIEDVHNIKGASGKATFSFGEIKGIKIGMVVALASFYGWRLELVHARIWQNEIWTNSDKVYQPKKANAKSDRRKVDTKKTSLMAAKRLFPKEDFKRTPKCSVAHDGLVDGALIALYMYLRYK